MKRASLLVSLTLLAAAAELASGNAPAKRSDDELPLNAVVESLVGKVSTNSAEISALKARLAQTELHIAFHAEFTTDPVQLAPSQRLLLDHVITNAGNGYDATTGQFQAPVTGSYMFVVNFMGDRSTYNYVNMLLDGNVVDYSISHGDGATWDHVSETLILHMNVGQRVWLERGHEQNVIKTIRGSHWTTFSGFLIRADA